MEFYQYCLMGCWLRDIIYNFLTIAHSFLATINFLIISFGRTTSLGAVFYIFWAAKWT